MKVVFIILNFLLLWFSNNEGAILFISDDNKQEVLTLAESKELLQTDLNRFYSNKRLGSFVDEGKTYFRLFAPNAKKIILATFEKPEQEVGKEFLMQMDKDGVWEFVFDGEHYGLFYGFKVTDEAGKENSKTIALDPYAKAVATFNTYLSPRRAIVVKEGDYNWEGDEWIQQDWRDLIIYEMHIKDLTAHSSSGSNQPGTYKGLVEKEGKGGINYIKSLGVNSVELLPSQEFANIEIPYKKHLAGKYNAWNPYERNYWGYMTASFFAPAAYYAEDWKELQWNTWMGKEAKAVTQFKDMVKAFHKEGISVMMDVVYNHLSEFELGNLKEIDSKYYFRFDDKGNYKSESGCGNDIKTERPMARRMIIESILYWMKEYHIDGFRFDLGKLIDWETIEEIIREAKKVNPNVVFVCEPWGGGYDPAGFSLRGWGSWNDQIRNGVKGENPNNGQGWIFGKWYGNNNADRIKSYVNGTLVKDKLGLFQQKEHSVNYLESHDGYTLGDFIRIGTGEVKPDIKIKDVEKNAALSPLQLKLNKLASLFLFTSQGITMIDEGQEYARSKVIPTTLEVKDSLKGTIDHNSYNKDNETNYLNFNHADLNRDLVNYYKGLIELRKKYTAFRRANYEDVKFIELKGKPFALGYSIKYEGTEFLVLLNSENKTEVRFDLPEGEWDILVNPEKAGIVSLGKILKTITLQPKDGYVLIKK
ncbi:MAG: alpha-amylase family glycosyl hydrolase [Ignavibacteriales bacterium]|nr:alpha-amylase family glycosyl hydrolase [Ignavibacteriales bacterium]